MLQKMKESRTKILIGLALLIGGFMIGRYSTPTKTVTKIEEKIVTKEVVKWKVKKVKDESKNLEKIIVETKMPDGTIRKETRIVDKGVVRVDTTKDGSKSTETSKVTKIEKTETNQNNDWHVSALAMPKNGDYTNKELSYGLHVERRIIGPFYLGVFGVTDSGAGLSIGGSF